MKFRLPTLLAAGLATAAVLPAQTSVWKVTKGSSVLYLGGTCHVLRPSDFPLPPEFDAAFAAAQEVWFETDIGAMSSPETQQQLLAQGMLPDGQDLKTVLKPATWAALQKYCADAGLPAEQFRRLRPWLLTVTIALMEMQKLGLALEGVDHFYHQKATAAAKPVRPLEPLDEHLAYLVNLGAGHEDEMVLNTVEDVAEMPALLKDILAAWRAGDVARIDQSMLADVRTKYPAIYAELFVRRNRAWLPVIEAMFKSPGVELVLVGAGHLAGRDGLLATLRQRGCRVEQLVVRK